MINIIIPAMASMSSTGAAGAMRCATVTAIIGPDSAPLMAGIMPGVAITAGARITVAAKEPTGATGAMAIVTEYAMGHGATIVTAVIATIRAFATDQALAPETG